MLLLLLLLLLLAFGCPWPLGPGTAFSIGALPPLSQWALDRPAEARPVHGGVRDADQTDGYDG